MSNRRGYIAYLHACVMLMGSMMIAADSASGSEASSLTLQEALQIADHHARPIQIAQQEVSIARGQITEVRADALPQLGLHFDYTHIDEVPILPSGEAAIPLGQRDNYEAAAELQQVLYAGGGIRAAQNLAREYESAAHAKVDHQRTQTAFQVHQAFNQVLRKQAHVEVAEEAMKLAERNYEIVRQKEEQGISTSFDRIRAESQRSQRSAEQIAAENELEKARLALFRLLDMPLDSPRTISGALEVDPPDMPQDELQSIARQHRPDLAAARYEVAMKREGKQVARSDRRPNVVAFGRYQQSNPDRSYENEWEDEWMVGVRAEMPIFQGGRTRGKLNQSRARLEQARLQYDDLLVQAEWEIAQALANIRTTERLLEAETAFAAESREALRLATRSYEEGLQEQIDVLSAQVALAESERRLADATYNQMMAYRELERATGTLLTNPLMTARKD